MARGAGAGDGNPATGLRAGAGLDGAAVVFVIVAPERIDWLIVVLIAVGSTIGGVIGSTVGRRLPSRVLRAVIVVVGLVAVTKLVFFP